MAVKSIVRTENADLHTTFPRRRSIFPKLAGGVVAVVVIGLVGGTLKLIATGTGYRFWLAQSGLLVFVAIVVLLLSVVALPGVGSIYQTVRQRIGATSWMYDLYQGLKASPGVVPRLALSILGPYWASGFLIWGLARGLSRFPGWTIGPVAAGAAALAALLWLFWLSILWHDSTARDLGRGRNPALPEQVKRLSMVQALSWTKLPAYRALESPGKSPQRPMIFVSSFNEGYEGYVGGFIEGMEQSLNGPWGLSPGFPKVADGFRQFMEYVSRTSFPLDHSFFAFPHLSVVDIRNALAIDRSYRSLRYEIGGKPGRPLQRGTLTQAKFDQFLARNPLAMMAIPDRPQLWANNQGNLPPPLELPPARGGNEPPVVNGSKAANTKTTTTILVSAMPFDAAQADAVRAEIGELTGGDPDRSGIDAHAESPFMNVPGTHIARLTVIAPWVDEHTSVERPAIHVEQPNEKGVTVAEVQPKDAWLLLSAQFDSIDDEGDDDGGDKRWLEELYRALGAHVSAIFGEAATFRGLNPGFHNPCDFVKLVESGRHEPIVRVVDHPDCTIWDVLRSLITHREVTGFLRARQPGLPPQGVLDDFADLDLNLRTFNP